MIQTNIWKKSCNYLYWLIIEEVLCSIVLIGCGGVIPFFFLVQRTDSKCIWCSLHAEEATCKRQLCLLTRSLHLRKTTCLLKYSQFDYTADFCTDQPVVSLCSRSDRAANLMWFVVNKQTLTSQNGWRIHCMSSGVKGGNVSWPALIELLKGTARSPLHCLFCWII